MGLLPENHAARIAFFQSRLDLWNTNSVAMGSNAPSVADVATAVTAASDALSAMQTAHNAAKTATQTLFQAMDGLTNKGNVVIEQVRTKSRTSGDSVYNLADLPVPATPTPKAPPG